MNYRGNKIVGIRQMAARRRERDICSFRLKSCTEIRGGGDTDNGYGTGLKIS